MSPENQPPGGGPPGNQTPPNQRPPNQSPGGQPPPQAVASLPVIETVVSGFAITFRNPVLLIQAAAGGLVILGISFFLPLVWPNALTIMLALFAPLLAYCHFGVNWYRIVLMGPAGLLRPMLRWDARHWRFLGYALVFNAAFLMIDLLALSILPIPPLLVIAGLLYLAARFSFVFPAFAVDESYSLIYSWRHTAGQGLRFTAALLMAAIPLYLILSIIVGQAFVAFIGPSVMSVIMLQPGGMPDLSDPAASQALVDALSQIPHVAVLSVKMIFDVLLMAVLAVLFSIVALAFRTCTGWVPATPVNLPASPGDTEADDGGDSKP